MNPEVEAEHALIGAIFLTEGKALEDLTITAGDFQDLAASEVYRLCRQVWAKGLATTLESVAYALTLEPESVRRMISPASLHSMMSSAVTSSSAESNERIVRDAAVRRRMSMVGGMIVEAVHSNEDLDLIIDRSRAAIDKVLDGNALPIASMTDVLDESIAEVKSKPHYMPTPWAPLNHLMSGWRPGAMYVIGARPGSGKTMMGLTAATGLLEHGAVLMCTLEMSRAEIHKRVWSQTLEIPLGHLLDSNCTPEELRRLETARIDDWDRFYIDDNPMQTVASIRRNARTIHRRTPLAGIVVDYLQLMESPDSSKAKRHEQIAEWTRQLKILAKTFDVPVIVLSQLNRESARGALPGLSDLRESGAIEQDADVVMLLHRADETPQTLNVLVAKNRHGARAPIELRWRGKYATVDDHTFAGAA